MYAVTDCFQVQSLMGTGTNNYNNNNNIIAFAFSIPVSPHHLALHAPTARGYINIIISTDMPIINNYYDCDALV